MAAQIKDFWAWFQSVEITLRNLTAEDPLWADLTQRVRSLGAGGWEIGPAIASEARFMFAISPRGDREKLELCRWIVSQAPALPQWEFCPAKPRKLWRRRFRWSSRQIDIDASGWRFAVYRFEDGRCEVVLIGDVLEKLAPREQEKVLVFVLESELGEAQCIEKLCGFEIERAPSKEDEENSMPITDLFGAVSDTVLNS